MINMQDVMHEAQGGQATANIARRFHISEDEAQKAVAALIPVFSAGLAQKTETPGGIADLFGAVLNDRLRDAFENVGGLDDNATIADGNELVGKLFKSANARDVLAEHTSQATGLTPGLMKKLMPVVLSLLVGGLFNKLQDGGLGDLLDQMGKMGGANRGNSSGRLGSILGDLMRQSGGEPASQAMRPGGGRSGLFGGLFGGLLGGRQPPSPGPATGKSSGDVERADQIYVEGFDPDSLQVGLEQLGKMLRPDGLPAGRPVNRSPDMDEPLAQILDGRQAAIPNLSRSPPAGHNGVSHA